MPMMTIAANHVPAWAPAVCMGFAAGLVLVLSACASNYRAACVDAGKLAGSPELTACVQEQIDMARAFRGRHLKYGQGR